MAKGTVMEFKPDGRTVVVQHEAISNYMAAMTMPFKAKAPEELAGLHRGDEISFQLQVTGSESWVERITKIGTVSLPSAQSPTRLPDVPAGHPLLDYKFTNELGQAVSLNDFRGQALAITFFYTRCPIPDYCPRLSKNFQEAQQKLESLPGAPANWHFLSISFDTEFDSPNLLKAYGAEVVITPSSVPPDSPESYNGVAEILKGLSVGDKIISVGRNEKKLLDEQEIKDNCKILRQFDTGIGYISDGYCSENNTIYEVYESYHEKPKQIIKDVQRQQNIENHLNCKFQIIKDEGMKHET